MPDLFLREIIKIDFSFQENYDSIKKQVLAPSTQEFYKEAMFLLNRRVLVLLLLLAAAAGGCLAYMVFYTDFFAEKDLLQNPPAKRCGECHVSIYNQWKTSRHANAWTSMNFKKDSEEYRKQKCMGCHNPLVVSFDQKPEKRDFHKDDGVSCLACHFRGRKMKGPYDVFSPPHPTEQNTGYLQSGFCRGCHIRTFKEWKKTGSRTTCQSCHMKIYRGKMMDRFPHRLLHFSRNVGDHAWPVIRLTENELMLRASLNDGNLRVEMENTGVLHDLPTAQNGDPRLYLVVLFRDAAGDEVEKNRSVFAPQLETALKYKEKWSEEYFVPQGASQAEIILSIRRAWKDKKELLIKKIAGVL